MIILLIIFIGVNVSSQNINESDDTTLYYEVDKYPVLVTDSCEYELNELKEFINLNIQYPTNDIDCTGKVYISFVIEKNGAVSNKKFLRKLCPGFDENAMSVVDLMTVWKPGYKDNKPVRTVICIPIGFMGE